MPNTTPNQTPNEADLKLAEEIIVDKTWRLQSLISHQKKAVSQIITRYMQPERDELERLKSTHSTLLVALEYNRKERDDLKEELKRKAGDVKCTSTTLNCPQSDERCSQAAEGTNAAKILADYGLKPEEAPDIVQLCKERDAAQKEVERLNIDLNVVQPLYEEAEAENDQFRLQLTAHSNAMEKAREGLLAFKPCRDQLLSRTKSGTAFDEALDAIEAALQNKPLTT